MEVFKKQIEKNQMILKIITVILIIITMVVVLFIGTDNSHSMSGLTIILFACIMGLTKNNKILNDENELKKEYEKSNKK